MEQAGGDADEVELHVGEQVGDLERVGEVRFAGLARLGAVALSGEREGLGDGVERLVGSAQAQLR